MRPLHTPHKKNYLAISKNVSGLQLATTAVWTFNGKYNELTTSNLPFRPLHSQTLPRVNFTIFHGSRYNVFTAPLIVAYRRSSNLSDFLVWGPNFVISHRQPILGLIPMCKNYFTYKHISDGQTSYTYLRSSLQVKPDLSRITSAATLKTSFTWYSDKLCHNGGNYGRYILP